VLATQAVLAVAAATEEMRADNLQIALLSARTIGAALGILMERFILTSEDAWQRLRKMSQDLNRPLAVLAAELVETGTLTGLDETVD
jgi:AmiR/NasT family two-component response regulator